MSGLESYNQKRNFSKTKEPAGKSGTPGAAQLHFVVQHHLASRDHYDFRLEWEGTLLSWAVPKGPSLNPADKRLAMQVEDHPLAYRHFEGTIPKGEYGGGTVQLWDEGEYEPLGDMAVGLREGSLKFTLHGQRLRGKWALVHMKGSGKPENSWLLLKEKDGEARSVAGIDEHVTSVRTGRTMEQIAAGAAQPQSKNPFSAAQPQLARLLSAVPEGGGWLYELKYDGYRILSYVEGGRAQLLSRGGKDYTGIFRPAAEALEALAAGRSMVLDGEMVVLDPAGRSDFQALQRYLKAPEDLPLRYMLFDLLALDGADLRSQPLIERKTQLQALLQSAAQPLQYSAHLEDNGEALLAEACNANLEGIIGKRADSLYTGTRNGDWVKLKCVARQEFIIGGYTLTQRRSSGISALLLGVYEGKTLRYCGRAGGFSQRDMAELEGKFRSLTRKTPPFDDPPKPRAGEAITWLTPRCAAEIAFAEWTREGLLRHAKFKGLREDKAPGEIRRESASAPGPCVVAGVTITHPDKMVAPGVSKQALAAYYQAVGPRMLPFVRERLISAIRCPGGTDKPCFFKKHPGADSGGIHTMEVEKNGGSGRETYYYLSDLFGLISEVQMNTVEFHVWGSRAGTLEQPDLMVFDLDPDEGMSLDLVRQGVRDLKGILDELSLQSFLKTSGGKGYHVVLPLHSKGGWEAFRDFAKGIVGVMETRWPERYVSNVRKEKRRGKIFVDWIRNTRGATSVAPYSVRKREGMPVSMPIAWEELDQVAPDGISMEAALRRLTQPDPWAEFFEIANC